MDFIVDAPEVFDLSEVEVSDESMPAQPVDSVVYGICEKPGCGKRTISGVGAEMLCAEHTFQQIFEEEFRDGRRVSKEGPPKGVPLL